jgi:hypothetical protein
MVKIHSFRKVLIECGVLEPLCSLARSEDVELEIQRYAVLAIASKSRKIKLMGCFYSVVVLKFLYDGAFIIILLVDFAK